MCSYDLYRAGVGMMVVNADGLVLVGQRKNTDLSSGSWQMPQGGIDHNENPKEAAIRELSEEVGTTNVSILAESKKWYTYDLPKDIASVCWGGKYIGQKQKWFLMKFLGRDAEINIATSQPEFQAWQWIEMQKLPSIIVHFKKKLYSDLVQEFQQYFVNHK